MNSVPEIVGRVGLNGGGVCGTDARWVEGFIIVDGRPQMRMMRILDNKAVFKVRLDRRALLGMARVRTDDEDVWAREEVRPGLAPECLSHSTQCNARLCKNPDVSSRT